MDNKTPQPNRRPAPGPAARRAAMRRKKAARRRRLLVLVSIVLAVVLLAGLAVYLFAESMVQQGQSGQLTHEVMQTVPEMSRKTANILIAGIDYDAEDDGRDYSEGRGMTDVIMLACCDFENKTLAMLQIPRDTYVGEQVDTGGTGKINAVYSHGADERNRITNLAKVINDQFKLPVDYYITLDMQAFTDLIKILGGLQMYVPWDVTDDAGNVIHQGDQFLDADHVEWIIRQRHMYNNADLGRLEPQQYFPAAIFKTFMTFPLSDLIKVAPALVQYVNTDYSVPEIISMFAWLQKVDKANIGIARVPGGALYETNGHTGLYGANPVTCAQLLNDHFRPYQDPVAAEALGLPTGLSFPTGEIAPEMKYLGALAAPAA